jgi:hypothetical protein
MSRDTCQAWANRNRPQPGFGWERAGPDAGLDQQVWLWGAAVSSTP